MACAGNEFDAVAEGTGVRACGRVKFLRRHLGEPVAAELLVQLTGEERKTDVLAVDHRGVHERLAARHRTRRGPVVGIERSQALRTVAAFGDAENVETGGVDLRRSQSALQQLLPGPLFRGLIPAIPSARAGNAGNEIGRGGIGKPQCPFATHVPLIVGRTAAVEVEKQRPARFGALAFRAVVELHGGVGLQLCGDLHLARCGGAQRTERGELERVVGGQAGAPSLPRAILGGGHFGGREAACADGKTADEQQEGEKGAE